MVERQKPVTDLCPLAGRRLTVITVNEEVAEFESRRPDDGKRVGKSEAALFGPTLADYQSEGMRCIFYSLLPVNNPLPEQICPLWGWERPLFKLCL